MTQTHIQPGIVLDVGVINELVDEIQQARDDLNVGTLSGSEATVQLAAARIAESASRLDAVADIVEKHIAARRRRNPAVRAR